MPFKLCDCEDIFLSPRCHLNIYLVEVHWAFLIQGFLSFNKSYAYFQSFLFMAPHSSTLAWKIPWTEEPGGLQSMGSHRVGHNWVTSLSLFTFMPWRRKWQPIPVFLPGGSQGRGSLVGCCLWGLTESDTTERLHFRFHFHFHALEKEMATHFSVLAWRIPGMGEPSGLPSMGSHKVRHNWSNSNSSSSNKITESIKII